MKQPCERLIYHIVVKVKGHVFHEGQALVLSKQSIILLHDAHLVHLPFHNGLKSCRQFVGCLGLKILRGGHVAAVEYLADIIKRHRANGLEKDIQGERGSLFRSTIHAADQIIDLLAIANESHTTLNRLQLLWQHNLNRLVGKVAVEPSGRLDRMLRANFERFFETGANLYSAEPAPHTSPGESARPWLRLCASARQLLQELLDLCQRRGTGHQQKDTNHPQTLHGLVLSMPFPYMCIAQRAVGSAWEDAGVLTRSVLGFLLLMRCAGRRLVPSAAVQPAAELEYGR